jgi:tetratricopeptide (TPR) repeat protein
MGFESIESPQFMNYLEFLKDSVKHLRASYQNNEVSVDYTSSSIQNAYLIAYYPHYIKMCLQVFKEAHQLLSEYQDNLNILIENQLFAQEGELKVCFFASGPAPESVALCQYINQLLEAREKIPQGKLAINTFDLDYDVWSSSRHITREYILPDFYQYNFTLFPHKINLIEKNSLESFKETFQSSHIFFFQNCLNELAKEKDIFLDNFQYLIEQAPQKSLVFLADLCRYSSVSELMQSLESLAEDKGLAMIRKIEQGAVCLQLSDALPEILTQHLMTGESGLIPRRRINFNYSIFYKASEIDLKTAEAYFNQGLLYKNQQKWELALADYNKALELNPNFASAYYNRGLLYKNQQKWELALADYNKTLELNPNEAIAYNNRGNIYKNQQKWELALADYNKALELNPNYARAYNNRELLLTYWQKKVVP